MMQVRVHEMLVLRKWITMIHTIKRMRILMAVMIGHDIHWNFQMALDWDDMVLYSSLQFLQYSLTS